MAGNKKPRRAKKPACTAKRESLVGTGSLATDLLIIKEAQDTASDRMVAIPTKALDAFYERRGNWTHWRSMYFRVNTAMYLFVDNFVSEDAEDLNKELNDALAVLISIKDRKLVDDRWFISAMEYEAVRTAIEHANLLESETNNKQHLLAYDRADLNVLPFRQQHYLP